jgi:RecB family exonuclease
VVLEGRVDQIDPLGPPGDTAVELIDYKTGRPRSQKDADQSLQLSIYALAAREQLKLKPARLTFYNLTNNQPVSTARTAKDLDQAVDEIRAVADQIRRLLFQPAPGFVCRWCDYVPICPAHEETY